MELLGAQRAFVMAQIFAHMVCKPGEDGASDAGRHGGMIKVTLWRLGSGRNVEYDDAAVVTVSVFASSRAEPSS